MNKKINDDDILQIMQDLNTRMTQQKILILALVQLLIDNDILSEEDLEITITEKVSAYNKLIKNESKLTNNFPLTGKGGIA